jgi:hypothetical protein
MTARGFKDNFPTIVPNLHGEIDDYLAEIFPGVADCRLIYYSRQLRCR